jgi:hypothetical protein
VFPAELVVAGEFVDKIAEDRVYEVLDGGSCATGKAFEPFADVGPHADGPWLMNHLGLLCARTLNAIRAPLVREG